MSDLKWYEFSQSTSYGVFVRPAIRVYVQAQAANVADAIAQNHGVYFDPDCIRDCRCCGSRWSEASDYRATTARPEPEYERGVPYLYKVQGVPLAMWIAADGTVTTEGGE